MYATDHTPIHTRPLTVLAEDGERLTIRRPRPGRGNERRRAIAESAGLR